MKGNAEIINQIDWNGETVILGIHKLYVNSKLSSDETGSFIFNSLQEAVASACDGTEQNPTIIYIEPDVYWTDEPQSSNSENRLIGLKISQEFIRLIGLTENADEVIICGNRGQMAGAVGDWNTIGIANGFNAENITFANYCNIDLEYKLDPSKNYKRRTDTITQAQVITGANNNPIDKLVFKNCRFISFLNVFDPNMMQKRAYFKNCFIQCTDDSIGAGDINVYENCYFHLYSNHPSTFASNIIQAYLGCYFEITLRDPGVNSCIYFAKRDRTFAVIDCSFNGNADKLCWTDTPKNNLRCFVYNNSLNGKPVQISPDMPWCSIMLSGKLLKAFKVKNQYNTFNLLRGEDEWDPANQKKLMEKYDRTALKLDISVSKNVILTDRESSLLKPVIYPDLVNDSNKVKWSVFNSDILTVKKDVGDSITVIGHNKSEDTISGMIKASLCNGLEAVTFIIVKPEPQEPPAFIRNPSIIESYDGNLTVSYELNLNGRKDFSQITWYRSKNADGSDAREVCVSRLDEPMKTYTLTTGDIGYYLVAKVEPRCPASTTGYGITAVSSNPISERDVKSQNIYIDFTNFSTTENKDIIDGFWTVDSYRPIDISPDYKWKPEPNPWTYEFGCFGSVGYGLETTGRGARLLYPQAGIYGNMKVEVELDPQKQLGQGFGSATGQYFEIYIKFDPHTLTGYGLRIERTPLYGNAVRFTLYSYENGIGTPISDSVDASCFLTGCTIILSVIENVLTAHVETSTPQQVNHIACGLTHEVNLTAIIKGNTFGGSGVQHTGTVDMRNRIMLHSMSIAYLFLN